MKIIQKRIREWNVEVPWGKVAIVSWGNPKNPPILLLHGYMDTAATFILLVDKLPDKYYFVALDMPGHGKSDPFPPGLLVSQLQMLKAINKVVNSLKWKTFTFMAHSMGCVIGSFYHSVFPNRITSMIFLDPLLPLSQYYFVTNRLHFWYSYFYDGYYGNMNKYSSNKFKLYTQDQAVSLLVRNRGLSEDQAELVLSRSLVIMGIDSYRLSWEPRMKMINALPISDDVFYTVLTLNSVPTLCIDASETKEKGGPDKEFAENLLKKRQETLQNFDRIEVIGNHDVHITNPERLAPHIIEFLDKQLPKTKSKL